MASDETSPDFNEYVRNELPKLESSIRLSSNYFQILLNNAKPVDCYSWRVSFTDGKNVLEALNSRYLDYEAASISRNLFKTIMQFDIAEDEPCFVRSEQKIEDFVYDNFDRIYTSNPITEINFNIDKTAFESFLWERLGTKDDEIIIDIQHKGLIEVTSAEYIKFLHILTWQSVFDRDSQFVVRNFNYKPELEDTQLLNDSLYTNEVYEKANLGRVGNNDSRIGRVGFMKDIVSVGRHRHFLQIFPKRALFFPTITLFLYLRQKLRLMTDEDLSLFIKARHAREELDYQLFGLRVRDHFTNKIITIKEVTKKKGDKVKIRNPDVPDKTISVTKYYRDKYQIGCDGNLPCVVSDESDNTHYLLEYLTILDYQIHEKEGDDLENKTAENFYTQSYTTFTNCIKNCTIIMDLKKYLDSFGIDISSASINATGKQLTKPSIKYRQEYIDLDPNSFLPWKIKNKLELIDCPKRLSWAVINFDTNLTNKKLEKFNNNLTAFGKSIGLGRPFHKDIINSNTQPLASKIEKLINDYNNYDILIFIVDTTQHKNFRRMLKFYELGTNSVTVCVSSIEADANKSVPVITKIMHKVNARIGGLNFKHTPYPEGSEGPIYNLISQKWTPRQFIGLHWRQIDNNDMVGSITYTVNSNCVIRGSYFFVNSDIDSFEPCEETLLEALYDYQKMNGKSPMQVVLFMQISKLDDVKMLMGWTKDAIQSVTIKHKSMYPNQQSPIFIVVNVQTDSGDALFKAPNSDISNDNTELSVGTCLNKEIVDSRSFLLVQYRPSHASAIILPTRFTIFNEYQESITNKEIEYLTYYLCSIHPVECKMISLPLPLRAASDFTKRAFDNIHIYKKILSEHDNDEPQAKRSRIESMPDPFEDDIGDELRVMRLNRVLQPKSRNYFCA